MLALLFHPVSETEISFAITLMLQDQWNSGLPQPAKQKIFCYWFIGCGCDPMQNQYEFWVCCWHRMFWEVWSRLPQPASGNQLLNLFCVSHTYPAHEQNMSTTNAFANWKKWKFNTRRMCNHHELQGYKRTSWFSHQII